MTEEFDQESEPAAAGFVFDLLEGTWRGEGKGMYPTINSFDYRESITFERRGESSLFYVQRTEELPEGQAEFVPSHWESGFVDLLETNELRLANVQSGGRGEVLTGRIENDGDKIRLRFESTSFANDERMVASARTFELEGAVLRYEMFIATTRVGGLTRHLLATLRRVN